MQNRQEKTMKKRQPKLTIKSHVQKGLLALSALLPSQTALAHNKVAVIPMAGDDIPGISHPVAAPFTNSIGMQFNELPAGSFTMGSPVGEPGRTSSGSRVETEHTVTLTKAFGMQVTEVTNIRWDPVISMPLVLLNSSISHSSPTYPVGGCT